MERSSERSGKDKKRSRRSRSRSRSRDISRKHPSRRRSRSEDDLRSQTRTKAEKSRSPPRRRKTGFDQPPQGGIANLPVHLAGVSAPVNLAATSNLGPTGFTAPPMMGLGMLPGVQPPSQQATRHARRVYVGGLPPTANEQNIATFFSNALAAVGGTTAGPGPCVVNVYINYEKKFAFVEFRTVEETSNAMALDGIMFEGVSVRVRRPNDYNPAAASSLGPSVPNPNLNLVAIGLTSGGSQVIDANERVFVGGLPYYLNEEQCRELLGSFGPIKSFDLVKDRETGNSKGYGFVVYADGAVTDIACAGLNGMRMGERVLTVRRATESRPGEPFPSLVSGAHGAGLIGDGGATRVVELNEAVTLEEIANNEEYTDILEDMSDECRKYGDIRAIVIPRPPQGDNPPPSGLGKVIIEFDDASSAFKARMALDGRKFGGRNVTAKFMNEDLYSVGQFD